MGRPSVAIPPRPQSACSNQGCLKKHPGTSYSDIWITSGLIKSRCVYRASSSSCLFWLGLSLSFSRCHCLMLFLQFLIQMVEGPCAVMLCRLCPSSPILGTRLFLGSSTAHPAACWKSSNKIISTGITGSHGLLALRRLIQYLESVHAIRYPLSGTYNQNVFRIHVPCVPPARFLIAIAVVSGLPS